MTATALTTPATPLWLLYAQALSRWRNANLDVSLPDIRFAQPGFRIAPDHLARYRALCGFRHPDEIPITYFYVMTLRLQLGLVTDHRFPYRTAGLVHTACAINQFQDIDPTASFDLSIHLNEGAAVSSGREIVFVIEVAQHGQRAAECRAAFRVRGPARPTPGQKVTPTTSIAPSAPRYTIAFAADAGRIYARLSGDYNPIHLSPLLARAFGFRTAIAHGMYSAARTLAMARAHCDRPIRAIDVLFRRPVPLPSDGLLALDEHRSHVDFEMVRKSEATVTLSGRCGFE